MMNTNELKDIRYIHQMDRKERCKRLVTAIQNLELTEVKELFRLLHNNKCEYTRNNNGIFVNLSWLPEDMLCKIETYVAFCTKSRCEVKKYESLCDVLNKGMHDQREHKHHSQDIATIDPNTATTDASSKGDGTRKALYTKVSSSMRFYLLKKRYAKQVPLCTCAKSDLKHEPYVL